MFTSFLPRVCASPRIDIICWWVFRSKLLHLAVNGHAQAVANVSLCSRRLWRLCGTESLWVDMCRSVYAFSSLPRGTPALRHCYAARRALPLRLAHELDLAPICRAAP